MEHYRRIKRILLAVLALNWLVALAKIAYGLSSRCSSMAADGMHSLSDGTSNILGLIGITLASRPTDADHPYGHKKYETLFSLGIAGLLVVISFNLVKESIERFLNPLVPRVDALSFLVMLATLALNILVMRYEYKKGVELKSDFLVSDSLHTRSDIFTSLSVIVALVVIKLGYPVLDPIVAFIIALFIAKAAFGIMKRSSEVLCDQIAGVDTQKIADIVLGIKGVRACHKIRTRGRPDDVHIDLHVQVNPDMHVDNAHKISYSIEEEIRNKIPGVTDVVVHMEPEEK